MPSTYFVHCRCTYLTQELKYTSEYKIPINDPGYTYQVSKCA